jgi:hypothetical protein
MPRPESNYPARPEAELAQAALAVEGVASVIAADDAGGAYPFDLTGAARLLVDEADVEFAAAILADQRHLENRKERS